MTFLYKFRKLQVRKVHENGEKTLKIISTSKLFYENNEVAFILEILEILKKHDFLTCFVVVVNVVKEITAMVTLGCTVCFATRMVML